MRRAALLQATPKWLSREQKNEIRALYELSGDLTEETGIEHHVDHIISLNYFENVSGLHVPWNLQVFSYKEHRNKTNEEQAKKRKDPADGLLKAYY